jgi:hypothetical protein
MSAIRRSSEKITTYRCGSLIVLVNAITNTNPECNKKSCNSNYAKSKASRSTSYIPPSHYECMESENLVSSKLVFRKSQPRHCKGGTYESDHCDPEFGYLFNNALDGAIRASFDDPVVDPSNAEDTSRRLQDIVCKQGKLSHKLK